MTREFTKPLVVRCPGCGSSNVFNQPYAYHAGFGNQGFLYNETGNCTLVWSSFDPDYEALVGRWHPWALTEEQRTLIENALKPAPDGTRWLFDNPARCLKCGHPISGSIRSTIYYLQYENSPDVGLQGQATNSGFRFKDVLRSANKD